MIIPKMKRSEWKLLHEHGDIKQLATFTGTSHVTIRKALKGGDCSLELVKKIASYYANKQAEINKALKPA